MDKIQYSPRIDAVIYGPLCAQFEREDWVKLAEASADQATVLGRVPDGKAPDDDHAWWCAHCRVWVQNEHVTYSETHDPRYGGCGHDVANWG